MDRHECQTIQECWMWWVGTWRGHGDTNYGAFSENSTIAKELWDYHDLLSDLPYLYDEITGGRVSKPNTSRQAVADVVAERINSWHQTGYDEGYDNGYADGQWAEAHKDD